MSEKTDKLWQKDDYLKPVDPNDPLLMYDIEEDSFENGEKQNDDNHGDDEVNSIKNLRKELDEMRVKAEFLEKALSDVENMRQITRFVTYT